MIWSICMVWSWSFYWAVKLAYWGRSAQMNNNVKLNFMSFLYFGFKWSLFCWVWVGYLPPEPFCLSLDGLRTTRCYLRIGLQCPFCWVVAIVPTIVIDDSINFFCFWVFWDLAFMFFIYEWHEFSLFFFLQVLLEIAFSASLYLYSGVALKVTVAMTARMYRRDQTRAISKARVYRGMFGARRAELLASLYGLMGSAGY